MTVNVLLDSASATSQSLDSYPRIQFTYDCECTTATIGQCQCYNKSIIRVILGYNLPMTVNVPMLPLDSTSATSQIVIVSYYLPMTVNVPKLPSDSASASTSRSGLYLS